MDHDKIVYLAKRGSISPRRLFPALADNCRVFISQNKPRRGPLFAVWTITSRCNLKCVFCDCWRAGDYGRSTENSELNPEDRSKVLKKVSDAGVWFLSFCGGEPLLCEDLEGLIRSAKSYGMITNISTNGLLLKDKAESVVKAGIDFITISIDSHLDSEHDRLRGHDGLLRKIVSGIEAVKSFRSDIYIEIRCLVNKLNYMYLEDFVKALEGKVNAILFKPICENSFAGYRLPPDMRIGMEDEGRMRAEFKKFLQSRKAFDNSYNRNMPDYFFNPIALKKCHRCFAGTFFASIDRSGYLYSCQEAASGYSSPLGNLTTSGFMDLWKGDGLMNTRTEFKEGLACDCWMDRFHLNIGIDRFLRPIDKLVNAKYDTKTKAKIL